jgi:hypothetical protein
MSNIINEPPFITFNKDDPKEVEKLYFPHYNFRVIPVCSILTGILVSAIVSISVLLAFSSNDTCAFNNTTLLIVYSILFFTSLFLYSAVYVLKWYCTKEG